MIFFFMEHDIEKQKKPQVNIFSVWAIISGLKINFHENELFCFGEAKDHADLYADLFGCRQS
jgi:hypothetical protein